MSKVKPLVAIHCLVYNHEPYLRDCFEGFVMQQTNFPFVAIVHDDASTDNSAAIIREYEAKYPHIFKPIYEKENLYQKGGFILINEVMNTAIEATGAKYVAKCEGDDYWTDPLKLKKQVDFMEANPEYSVCFHDCTVYNTWSEEYVKRTKLCDNEDFDITVDDFLNGRNGIGQPLTMLFRMDVYDYEWQKHYTRFCDTMEIMHLLIAGKGRFINFVGGQYNLHQGGISATNPDIRRSWESCEDAQEMWNYTQHLAVKRFYIDAVKWRLDICKRNKMHREYWQAILYALRHNFSIGMTIVKYAIKRGIKDIL